MKPALKLVVGSSTQLGIKRPRIGEFERKYARGEYVPRPYRIKDSITKKDLRWCCYTYVHRAIEGADKASLWTPVGRALEVYDVRNGDLFATFIIHVSTNGRERNIQIIIEDAAKKHYKPVRKDG